MEYRPIQMSDLPFWEEIFSDSDVKKFLYSPPPDLWEYLNLGKRTFTVLQDDEMVAGFTLSPVTHHTASIGIVVHHKFRGSGLGDKLMELIETEASSLGYKTLRADVYIDNLSCIGLLNKCGWHEIIWFEKNL